MKTRFFRCFLLLLLATFRPATSSPTLVRADDGPTFTSAWFRPDGFVRTVMLDMPYAYVGLNTGLLILDVTEPLRPRPVGSLPVPVSAAARDGHRLYTITPRSFAVIDVRDPTAPVLLGRRALPLGMHHAVAAYGNYAYIGHQDGLAAVDVSDPAAPRLVGEVGFVFGHPAGVVVRPDPSGEHILAYLSTVRNASEYGGGLYIVDVTNPADMQVIHFPPGCDPYNPCDFLESPVRISYDLALRDRYAYVLTTGFIGQNREWANGLTVYDITDGNNVQEVGRYLLSDTLFLHHLAVAEDRVYIAADRVEAGARKDELFILDVRDGGQPRLLAQEALAYDALFADMAAAGPCVYIAQRSLGLQILCDASALPTSSQVWLPLLARRG